MIGLFVMAYLYSYYSSTIYDRLIIVVVSSGLISCCSQFRAIVPNLCILVMGEDEDIGLRVEQVTVLFCLRSVGAAVGIFNDVLMTDHADIVVVGKCCGCCGYY